MPCHSVHLFTGNLRITRSRPCRVPWCPSSVYWSSTHHTQSSMPCAIVSIVCLLVIYASHAVVHAVCHGVHHLFTGNTNKDCYVFCILLCCVLYLLRVIVLWSGDCVVCYVCCVWLCCDPAIVFCATSAACDCVAIRRLCSVLHLLRVIVLWFGDCVVCYICCVWLCCDPVIVFCAISLACDCVVIRWLCSV